MINIFRKIINSKYSRIFKFIFLIRYLFLIFLIATILFLLIPKFFDYKKREVIIFKYLEKSYGLILKNYDNMKYNLFPIPHIVINNSVSNFHSEDINLITKKLIIYPKLISIYNYKDFNARKINLNQIEIITELKEILTLYEKIFKIEKKITLKNLSIQLNNLEKKIIHLKKIEYSNFGYNKNNIFGKVFDRKFQIKLNRNLEKVDFKLQDIGVFVSLNFLNKKNLPKKYTGKIKAKILQSNLMSDFTYSPDSIHISNFFFRDKDLSFNGKGTIYLKPYFKIKLSSSFNNINTELIKRFKINEFLNSKDLIKKLNFRNDLVFKPSKYSINLVENLNMETDLNYGRLVFYKKFSISNSIFLCEGDVNLLDEFPIINFNCSIESKDKKRLLKKFKINYENEKESLNLNIVGDLNILNNKINFYSIRMNNNYSASNEDLKYFKETFENILLDRDFINIFNVSKIKNFILEML